MGCKIALLVGMIALVGCGGAPFTAPGIEEPGPEDAHKVPRGTLEAGTDAPPDASADVITDTYVSSSPEAGGEDLAKCRREACAASGYACGAPPGALCGGSPVDCGGCSSPSDTCGDNGNVGQCGHYCEAGGWEGVCASGGRPNASAFLVGCHAPYWLLDGKPSYRPGGTDGCVPYDATSSGLTLLCCP